MNIDKNGKLIIDLLVNNGFKAYVVGGFVRNSIMQIPTTDTDIATSALVEQTEKVLNDNNIKYIETGIKHGTVTAIIDDEQFEITTFRTDGKYDDYRHPDNVKFVSSLKEDLKRRDFTINAMAYNEKDGLIDLFGGKNDIDNRIIRTVGNPDTRFKEDALRIMRALRFSSTLYFDIEPNTKKAIFDNAKLLDNVSKERIFDELCKLLLGDNVENVLIEYKDIIAQIIPELIPTFDCEQHTKWHKYDVYTHSVKSIAYSPKNIEIRLTMLLHDIAKPVCKTTDDKGVDHFKGHPKMGVPIADNILKRFKVSNNFRNKILMYVRYHDYVMDTNRPSLKRWINKVGRENIENLIEIKISDMMSHNLVYAQTDIDYFFEIRDVIRDILDSDEPMEIKQLAVNGNDLKEINIEGEEIGETLNFLLDRVIENPVNNDKDYLLRLANIYIENK